MVRMATRRPFFAARIALSAAMRPYRLLAPGGSFGEPRMARDFAATIVSMSLSRKRQARCTYEPFPSVEAWPAVMLSPSARTRKRLAASRRRAEPSQGAAVAGTASATREAMSDARARVRMMR